MLCKTFCKKKKKTLSIQVQSRYEEEYGSLIEALNRYHNLHRYQWLFTMSSLAGLSLNF